MKKYLNIVLVVAAFIFISPFSVSAAAEEEWGEKLDLSDSVSSSVIKLDDGIVVMKYEGGASDNSTLTKYDFNGNEVWSIKNDFGYEIGALNDGFLVYNNSYDLSMTKISSDGKVVWNKNYGFNISSSNTRLVSFDSGFVIYDYSDIYRFDNNGNLLRELSRSDVAKAVFGRNSYGWYSFSVSLSNDRNSLLIYLDDHYYTTGSGTGYYHAVAEYSLNLDYKSSTIAYTGDQSYRYLTKVVETDNNYIVTGNYTMVFNKKGQIDKVLNLPILDIQYIDGYIYAYVGEESESYGVYDTYIGKYDENMNKVMEYQLPDSFNNSRNSGSTYTEQLFLNSTSFAYLKNRNIFYGDSNGVHFVLLNSTLTDVSGGTIYDLAYPLNNDYGLAQYRLTDDNSNNAVTDDGIINNIFQNPETSSIAVVIAFVIVILLGGIGFYFGYRKKKVKNM